MLSLPVVVVVVAGDAAPVVVAVVVVVAARALLPLVACSVPEPAAMRMSCMLPLVLDDFTQQHSCAVINLIGSSKAAASAMTYAASVRVSYKTHTAAATDC